MNQIAFEQIISLLGLIGIWAIWYFLWKPQRVDVLRQRLFALRSDLFDLAANDAVSFSHPAYTELRMMINGVIKFAHRVSLPAVLLAAKMPRMEPNDYLSAWKKTVQKLPEDTGNRLLEIHEELSKTLTLYVIRGSLLLWFYLVVRITFALTTALFRLLIGKMALDSFTVAQAKHKLDREYMQSTRVTRIGAESIESRVLYEEHRRARSKREHAYAQ